MWAGWSGLSEAGEMQDKAISAAAFEGELEISSINLILHPDTPCRNASAIISPVLANLRLHGTATDALPPARAAGLLEPGSPRGGLRATDC